VVHSCAFTGQSAAVLGCDRRGCWERKVCFGWCRCNGSSHQGASCLGSCRCLLDDCVLVLVLQWHAAGQLSADDTFAQDVLTAATKICKTLGDLCKPYLPIILPKLFEAVNRDLEVRCRAL
jgi:hypothetical protein